MICIEANIPKELSDIDDELKAIYQFKNTVCRKNQRNTKS
jgi:hypothetical protein